MQELDLKGMQQIEMTLMRELDEICRKNDIKYSIMYGSLIGAVRHKGFIPWDDDIDVVLLRKDYEKLISILEKNCPEDRFIQNISTDSHFEFGISRYCMKNTYCFAPERKKLKSKKYIYIDIFPLDNLPDDDKLAMKQIAKMKKIKESIYYKMHYCYPHRTIFGHIKTFFQRVIRKIIPLKRMTNKLTSTAMKYNDVPSKRVINFFGIYSHEKETFNREWFENLEDFEYENEKFQGTKNYDDILTQLYGDYMTPPPVTKQVKRHNCYVLSPEDDIPKKYSIKSNYFFNLIVSVLESIIPLITTPFIARIIGPDGTGIYSYTYSLITMFTLAGALGSATHAQRQIAMHSNDKKEYSKIFYEIFILRLIFLTVSFVAFLITVLIMDSYIVFFLLQIPYFLAAIFDISWLYQGLEDFKYIAVKNLTVKILGLAAIFVFVKSFDDLWLYVFILSLSIFLGQASLWIRLKRYIVKVDRKEIKWKRHLNEVIVYFVPTIAYQLYSLINKVILGALSTEAETGYYEHAQKIINLCVSFLSAYNIVIRSRMSMLFAKQDKKEIDTKIHQSLGFVIMLGLPMTLGIMGVASDLIPWYLGDEYLKVSKVLFIFAPIILIISLRTCIGAIIFTPFGLQKKSNLAQIIAAVINCASTAILIPKLASIGAVISSMMAETFILIYYVVYCHRKKYISFTKTLKIIYKYLIAGAIMFVTVYFFGVYVTSIKGIVKTITQVLIGAGVYGIILLILRDKFVLDNISKILKIRKRG